ncbi:PspC domain-containing protein [Frondihabitans sp. PAMC 28766]|uniref:PspC domain-containing protein n=1 Tax=Frondihabitans sp. PAMC 28766 TaxID=1795630 RepID=UPI000AE220B2|nr:PspC domain-containing protein [Frondihabitans sp. PAMC 28766]
MSGVSEGLAEHLGWRVGVVRWAFALSILAGGAGILLYLWLWALTPLRAAQGDDPHADADDAVRRRIPVPLLLVGLAAVLAVLSFAVFVRPGSTSILGLTVPLVIALALGAVAWSRWVEPPPSTSTG